METPMAVAPACLKSTSSCSTSVLLPDPWGALMPITSGAAEP